MEIRNIKKVTTGLLIVSLMILAMISNVYADAQENVTKAEALYYGKGTERDYKQAFKLFSLAADAGNADAQAMMANYYYDGLGTSTINKGLAFQFAQKASTNNSLYGTYLLAEFYMMGIGTTPDANKAQQLFTSIGSRMTADAEKGNIQSQANLGLMYALGLGVEKNPEMSVKMLISNASKGLADAQYTFGMLYENGIGIPFDLDSAIYWLRLAGEQGSANAQTQLAIIFMNAKKDDVEAVKWLAKAAEQGEASSQNNLGVMYYAGRGGITKNDAEASKWFLKSAEQGYARAQYTIGTMYISGTGLKKDEAEAFKWIHKAAEQGMSVAQEHIGWMYENGRGTAKDINEAITWYKLAAASGDAHAKESLNRLNK
ncbi:MAG: sel1 repeat family protein [Nitrospirae bacterium]|nr:sel1 repeat family protein [Nitrospirota bacterium]MBF0541180.1 sel1 repeat family protein [Nitrospirota bacterium]